MTVPNPATWPIPSPQDGLREALRLVDAMVDAGAMDEEHPHILDPTIDSWVDVWKNAVVEDRQRRCDAIRADLDTAHAEEQFAQQDVEDAQTALAIARVTLSETGIRSEVRSTAPADPASDAAAEDGARGAVPGVSPLATRTPSRGAPVLVPEPPDARSRVLTVGPWVLLVLMGIADAYGFWQTLVTVLQHQDVLTLFFVVALVLGAILVAHQVGRVTRQYRSGQAPGARQWIAVMACAWFALGVLIFWIRAHPPAESTTIFGSGDASGTGVFATDPGSATTATSGGTATWAATWGIATLFFVLYCLTGVLAMTHAFQVADERPRQRRLAMAGVVKGQADAASARYYRRLAERKTARIVELLTTASEDRSGEADCDANGLNIKHQIRIHLSRRLASGSATTAVTAPPVAEPPGPTRPRPDDGPAAPAPENDRVGDTPEDRSDVDQDRPDHHDENRGDRP